MMAASSGTDSCFNFSQIFEVVFILLQLRIVIDQVRNGFMNLIFRPCLSNNVQAQNKYEKSSINSNKN